MEEYQIQLDSLVTGDNLTRHFRSRNRRYTHKIVPASDIEKYIESGWERRGRKKGKKVAIRKTKPIGEDFQDEVWCVFYRMGFSEMNGSKEFAIPRIGLDVDKNIDIFAKEDNCICLVECKASEQPHTKKSLGVDIDQYAAIHEELEHSIRLHYKNKGDNTKYRFRWLLVLKNIDLNDNDYARAKKANIVVIDDTMIQYYSELAKHLGPASRYQFLADLYPGMEIPEMIEPIPAIRGKFGGVTFYSFVIEPEKLLKIAYISHRGKTNEESMKTYQRMVKRKRLNVIANYITEKRGIFPTNIVLNIETSGKKIRFDQAAEMAGKNAVLGTLYLPNRLKTAWLIDGQHRLFAYSGLPEAKTATLPVLAFVDLDGAIQQQLFIDINGEQVRVSKNLLNDLYDDLLWNSKVPKDMLLALTSKLVKVLNESAKSPLRDRIIKVGGRRTATRNLTLTTLTEELRRTKLLGYVHSIKAKEISPGALYQNDLESSLGRAVEVLSGYFSLFLENESVKKQWESGGDEGGYICTNQGMRAILRVLKAIFDHLEQKCQINIRNRNSDKLILDIKGYITPVIDYLGSVEPSVIRQFRQQYAEAGVQASAFTLMEVIRKKYPDFHPTGLKEYISKTDTTNNQAAYDGLCTIETIIHGHVISKLKAKYGEGLENWWHKGIKEKVRINAATLANKSGVYSGYEKYLYLIDLKEIIEDNWDIFSEVYTINAKPTDSRVKRLSWYTELNRIRDIAAHPPRGGVNDDELAFVNTIKDELSKRLSGS